MKRLLYILTFLALGFVSCDKEEDTFASDVFEESPEERVLSASNELRTALLSSEYGWKTNYFTNEEEFVGHYMIMKFTEDWYVDILGSLSGQSDTSTYRIYHSNDLELSFDTWNDNLTPLMEPKASFLAPIVPHDVDGKGGDIEFYYRGLYQDGNEIQFMGKQNGSPLVLTKATAQDWEMWRLEQIENKLSTDLFEHNYITLRVDDEQESKMDFIFDGDDEITFKYNEGEEIVEVTKKIGFYCNGFCISTPLLIDGFEITSFNYIGEVGQTEEINQRAKEGEGQTYSDNMFVATSDDHEVRLLSQDKPVSIRYGTYEEWIALGAVKISPSSGEEYSDLWRALIEELFGSYKGKYNNGYFINSYSQNEQEYGTGFVLTVRGAGAIVVDGTFTKQGEQFVSMNFGNDSRIIVTVEDDPSTQRRNEYDDALQELEELQEIFDSSENKSSFFNMLNSEEEFFMDYNNETSQYLQPVSNVENYIYTYQSELRLE